MMFIGHQETIDVGKKLFLLLLMGAMCLSPLHSEEIIGLNSPDRFDRSRNDVVTDRATHLIWRTCSLGQVTDEEFGCKGSVASLNWNAAKKLETSEWRLPTKNELLTLIDSYRNESKSSRRINITVFYKVDKTKLNYWTSDSAGENEAWYVNFGLGPTSAKADKKSQFAVRLVKGTFVSPAPEIKPPKDIEIFIGRRDSCEHYAGEFDGYDAKRSIELERMMQKIRCETVDTDEKKLRKKYQDKADMLKWLDDRR